MSKIIKILMVEHNPDDIELISDELKNAQITFVSEIVEQEAEYIRAIENFSPDIILSDYSLPSFDGATAFNIREKIAPTIPFLFVSGSIGEEKSVEYIRDGVTDYVLKDKLFTIGVKVRRALKEAGEQKEVARIGGELALSESLLARAQTIARLGNWELSFPGYELKLSVEGARIFGLLPQQHSLTYEHWTMLVHPDDRDFVLAAIKESGELLKERSYYYRLLLQDGSIKHVYAESKIDCNKNGIATGLYGTIQDVTERKKAEVALKAAYDETNTILERIDDGFFATDKNYIITYWNKRAETLLNKNKKDVIGKTLHDVFASATAGKFYEQFQKAIGDNSTVRFEEFLEKTGKWFAVSAFASDNGLSVYFKDVTGRKKSDANLRESELRYRSLIEQATDAICIADASMKFVNVNSYACEVFGYTLEEALQISLPDILFVEDLEAYPLKLDELKLGKTIRNERRLKRKNGTAVYMEVSTKMMDDGMLIIFGHDITARKRAEQLSGENEKKYRQIVETAQEGIWLVDEHNMTTFVNRKMHEMLEYTEAEMTGRTNVFFKDESEKDKGLEQLARRREGYVEVHESKFITKSGNGIWVHVSANPVYREDGSYAGALAMMTDITERKRAEQEMTWLINNTEESFVLLDRNLNIISFNSQFHKLYWIYMGKNVEKGKCILDYAQPERRSTVINIYKRVMAGSDEVGEINIDQDNGAVISFALKYKPAKDEDGIIIGAFVSAIDVTEKKKSEQQLIMQEKRYRALVENGADGVVILTSEGKAIYVSPTQENILGYPEAEALQMEIFSLFHPDEISRAGVVWEEVMRNPGMPIPVSPCRLLHKNGTWRWLEGTMTNMLHDPAVLGIVDNFRDITEKKELENLLQKTNSLARIGSWEVDIKKATLYWSDITKEIHEAASDFVPDLDTAINFYKEGQSRAVITQKVQDSIENGLPFDVELQIVTARENEKWVRVLGEAEFDKGEPLKINGSFQDITARKLAEIKLNELNEDVKKHAKELAISNAELEQFAFVASHDLQEPLRMITSFLTQLDKKYRDIIDERGQQYIGFAVDGAKRMRQIILDLLEFSKVGRTEDSIESIDLNSLFAEIQILDRKRIEEKNAKIIVGRLPTIVADKTPIRQVFQNLVSNALKYSKENIPSEIYVSCEELGTHWQFGVSDNGIGIAEEYFDKIFIIFQRLHHSGEFSGTGMGLAVTKKIVENLGGKIWVESEEGIGSRFYFTLLK